MRDIARVERLAFEVVVCSRESPLKAIRLTLRCTARGPYPERRSQQGGVVFPSGRVLAPCLFMASPAFKAAQTIRWDSADVPLLLDSQIVIWKTFSQAAGGGDKWSLEHSTFSLSSTTYLRCAPRTAFERETHENMRWPYMGRLVVSCVASAPCVARAVLCCGAEAPCVAACHGVAVPWRLAVRHAENTSVHRRACLSKNGRTVIS